MKQIEIEVKLKIKLKIDYRIKNISFVNNIYYIDLKCKCCSNITKMVKYSCEKCGKEFTQKGHYTKHINKKNPCVIALRFTIFITSPVSRFLDSIVHIPLNFIFSILSP